MRCATLILLLTITTKAQFQLQQSHTTSSLRGIHAISNEVAWASGTNGTILHTTDGGTTWLSCTIPPDAEKLDFRGIQAFDAQTAIVMSSGKGDLSRLYKTTDACKSWKLVMVNEAQDGFWDAIRLWSPKYGFLVGDPVEGKMMILERLFSDDDSLWDDYSYLSEFVKVRSPHESAFAASNSCLSLGDFTLEEGRFRNMWFATGGESGAWVRHMKFRNGGEPETFEISITEVTSFPKTTSGGIFSLAFRKDTIGVAVGGDYQKPNDSTATAANTVDSGKTWRTAQTPPHGYRSSVAYEEKSKTWITVGPNGTDISRDDGKNWSPLKPAAPEPPDADKNWNALSLPFVVGPNGRIGKLTPTALKP